MDFRIAKKEHIKMIISMVNELCWKYLAEVKIIENVEPFYDEIKEIGKTDTTNFITEASLIKNSKRMILGVGPVTAHEVNEHISCESYCKLVEQYKMLIEKMCK